MIERHIRRLVFRLALRCGRHDLAYCASPSRYYAEVVGPTIARSLAEGLAR